MESELTARKFTIDHYEPVSARADLENDYNNLMYCCESCNSFKGDRVPSEKAREKGYAFFRPDEHFREDHFDLAERRLNDKTPVGFFTINALNLNRDQLQRLRDLRRRITDAEDFISSGIAALRRFPIDQLPREIRVKALAMINDLSSVDIQLAGDLDLMLRGYAVSPLEGDKEPPDPAENEDRLDKLKKLEGLHPGVWRGRGKPQP